MIKWLTGAPRKSPQWVTDDPLATIPLPTPTLVYAVTKVNPIFVEEDLRKKHVCILTGAGQSGSSGYESQRSSCSWSGESPPEEILEHPPVKSVLSPIPEGRIDCCIPRPIWPRYEGRQRKAPGLWRDGRRPSRTRSSRGKFLENVERVPTSCPYDLLRELSTTITLAAEKVPAEEILRDIGHRINQGLASHIHYSDKVAKQQPLEMPPGEVCQQRVGDTPVPILDPYSDAELEAGRLSLLRRLGRFPPCSGEPLYDLARGSSNSTSTSTSTSSTTSSGFSDLPPSPPSSAALRPFGPVFLHDNPTSVPTRMRNSMIYESLQTRPPAGYEKLGPDGRRELDSQWSVCEKSPSTEFREKQISVFPRPDFTLDGHQADLLLRRLQASKRQRCWCRFLTTALALVFFLFSVMAVSMMLTNGKRIFGSL